MTHYYNEETESSRIDPQILSIPMMHSSGLTFDQTKTLLVEYEAYVMAISWYTGVYGRGHMTSTHPQGLLTYLRAKDTLSQMYSHLTIDEIMKYILLQESRNTGLLPRKYATVQFGRNINCPLYQIERGQAIAMGTHQRIGKESPFLPFSPDLMQYIHNLS